MNRNGVDEKGGREREKVVDSFNEKKGNFRVQKS